MQVRREWGAAKRSRRAGEGAFQASGRTADPVAIWHGGAGRGGSGRGGERGARTVLLQGGVEAAELPAVQRGLGVGRRGLRSGGGGGR